MYQIFIDSSSGMGKELRDKYNLDYFPMGLLVNDKEYPADLDYVAYSLDQMYEWVRDPNVVIKTNLITFDVFRAKCEPLLKKGIDILYVACADALSGSRNNFNLFAEAMKDEYPDRKLISVDSCRAEMALGLIAIEASKCQQEGKSIEEVAKWVEDNKEYYHEVGSVETLKYLRAYGRVSGPAAFFADTLNIKPIIMFDIYGHNYSFKKVLGSKKAMAECFEYIKNNVVEGETDVIYIGITTMVPAIEYLKKRIEEELKIKVETYYIGPIVGICCGPGMYGCWFKGKLVTEKGE